MCKVAFEENRALLQELIQEANRPIESQTILPTALDNREQKFLSLLGERYFSGFGAIVDAGSALGGSCECFLKGIEKNVKILTVPPPQKIIYAYELGRIYDEGAKSLINRLCSGQLEIGDSFIGILEDNLNSLPNHELVEYMWGDICQQELPEIIEILFLDALKSKDITFRMNKMYRHLIPGKSVIIQQDFVDGRNPWLLASIGYLRDYLEFIGHVKSSSAVFLLKDEIPDELLLYDVYNNFSVIRLEDYIKTYFDYFDYPYKEHLKLTLAMLYFEKKQVSKAKKILASVRKYKNDIWAYEQIDNIISFENFYDINFLKKCINFIKNKRFWSWIKN